MSRIRSLDKIDGLMDGKIEPDQLRQALGLTPGVKVTRRVRKTSRRSGPPEAKLIEAPREPHPKRSKTARKRRASRSKTLAWKEGGEPAPGAAAIPVAPEAAPPLPVESMPAALRAAAEESGAVITDWRQSRGDADFTFEWRAFRGTARVRTMSNERDGSLRATLLSCFYNERQPSRSAQTCRTIMDIF